MASPEDGYTCNERWYLARTALWARQLRAGEEPGVYHPPDQDIAFAETVLGLRPGMRILDLGCGWGRTTLALHQRGYHVLGFDLSPDLLCLARERANGAGAEIAYLQGTVRSLPDLGRFDAACAFYDDSLVSFEEESDNLEALRRVALALRPGGHLLFGTTDCPLLLPPLQRSHRVEAGVEVAELIAFDAARRLGTSLVTYRDGVAPPCTYARRRRHYRLDEIQRLLEQAGLSLLKAWCAYDTAIPYGSRPEGMVIAARRGMGDAE